jgi:hypothetical protein
MIDFVAPGIYIIIFDLFYFIVRSITVLGT